MTTAVLLLALATTCPAVKPPTDLSKSFTVPPANVSAVEAAALADGWTPNAGGTAITNAGVTLSYGICGSTLSLTITGKPFFVPTETIWRDVDTWVATKPKTPAPSSAATMEF